MFSLFGKKGRREHTAKTIAILDIGSGSVAAAIVTLDRNGPPRMLAEAIANIAIDLGQSGARMEGNTLKAVEQALGDIGAQARQLHAVTGPIEHIAVFLSAPWANLFLRNMRYARRQEFRANLSLIEKLIGDFIRQERPDHDTTNDEIIERSAVGIRLNGYPVHEVPDNVMVSSLELTVVSSTGKRAFLDAVRDLASRSFSPETPLTFHSTTVASSYAMAITLPKVADYMLCNAEGEVTELLRVRDHIPVAAATAPTGCNVIIRTLRAHAGMDRREVVSALKLAQSESPQKPYLHSTLSSAKYKCAEMFRTVATELIKETGAPPVLYIAGIHPEAGIFTEAIAHAPYLKTLFPAGVGVENVNYAMLGTHVLRAPELTTQGENGLMMALEAIFLDGRFDRRRAFNFRLGKRE